MTPALPLLLSVGLAVVGDYRPDSAAWNGLARFVAVAEEAGCRVEARQAIDWDALGDGDVPFLVYPEATVDGDKLAAWVASGGRVFVADDFGGAAQALSRLGVKRVEQAPVGEHWRGHAALVVAHAVGDGPLQAAAPVLVTNHPAYFASGSGATHRFGDGQVAVVAGRLGTGRFVALSDPSALINHMLSLDGNRAFARAVVLSLCRPGRDRILLVAGDASAAAPSETLLAARVNDVVAQLNDVLAGHAARALVALGLAVLAVVVLGRALPGAPPPFGAPWTRAPSATGVESSGYASLVARYADGKLPWGDALLATLLREEVIARLAAAGIALDETTTPAMLGVDVADRFGDDAARTATALWRELRRVPSRAQPGRAVSPRALARMHARATALFAHLANPNSRRRT